MFLELQREATEDGRGLWGAVPSGQMKGTTTVEPIRGPKTTCDPAYPTVCISLPPPDLDCKDISHRRFKVLPPDPHRFNGYKDGMGCEK